MTFCSESAILRLNSDLLSRLIENNIFLMFLFKFFLNYINFNNYLLCIIKANFQIFYQK